MYKIRLLCLVRKLKLGILLELPISDVVYCTVLCCAVLHCTWYGAVLHFTAVLYCDVFYCTVLHCTAVLYCDVLHCTALHSTALNCIALHQDRSIDGTIILVEVGAAGRYARSVLFFLRLTRTAAVQRTYVALLPGRKRLQRIWARRVFI